TQAGVITTVRIAEKGRTLKALFAKNKGDISCKLLSEITFSRRFCSLPELLPDTYLRDASLATITPKRPIIVLRASGMFTMYAGI
ncbi:TPA: hypothetical protein ACIXX9_005516, partial [Escherichia coli]